MRNGITEKVLELSDLVLQLNSQLVDLSRLHVVMVELVSLDHSWVLALSVSLVHVRQEFMSLTEFMKHELLKGDNVNNIKLILGLVQDQDAELTSN